MADLTISEIEQVRDDAMKARRELTPLAAGLHKDNTIHIYVSGKDSGLWIDLDGKGGLIVGVNEATRMAAQEVD